MSKRNPNIEISDEKLIGYISLEGIPDDLYDMCMSAIRRHFNANGYILGDSSYWPNFPLFGRFDSENLTLEDCEKARVLALDAIRQVVSKE